MGCCVRAGARDRRIKVEVATETQDAAGDVIQTWSLLCERWAGLQDNTGRLFRGDQQIVRDADTMFTLMDDSQSQTFAPETHRFICDGHMYRIVSIGQGKRRHDELLFLCATRPDGRGTRGPVE